MDGAALVRYRTNYDISKLLPPIQRTLTAMYDDTAFYRTFLFLEIILKVVIVLSALELNVRLFRNGESVFLSAVNSTLWMSSVIRNTWVSWSSRVAAKQVDVQPDAQTDARPQTQAESQPGMRQGTHQVIPPAVETQIKPVSRPATQLERKVEGQSEKLTKPRANTRKGEMHIKVNENWTWKEVEVVASSQIRYHWTLALQMPLIFDTEKRPKGRQPSPVDRAGGVKDTHDIEAIESPPRRHFNRMIEKVNEWEDRYLATPRVERSKQARGRYQPPLVSEELETQPNTFRVPSPTSDASSEHVEVLERRSSAPTETETRKEQDRSGYQPPCVEDNGPWPNTFRVPSPSSTDSVDRLETLLAETNIPIDGDIDYSESPKLRED